ncbi:DUF3576 domain-containing protein [Thalassovita aquimarina]|uniref:DUF3576 domain-containing protein n=1 Tax=Thalassovita aquimarina TaxID=2785917 RepID=A0ABS5HPR7_9RHOB|nr:DUF3576 domain-containing protein [Thalassovita aquimarina]MBR9650578.1 DUF3576 domain-containing protein [Thalassovita aquimarina]
MIYSRAIKTTIAGLALASLAACGGGGIGLGGSPGTEVPAENSNYDKAGMPLEGRSSMRTTGSSFFDLFRRTDGDLQVSVNRYIWNASLEVLNFLPVQSVDPFTGVIVMGYGTPPGGGRAYRATVYIKDPALEARSLVVAMQTRGGRPVSADTQRAIEDAILARARQLRIKDGRF